MRALRLKSFLQLNVFPLRVMQQAAYRFTCDYLMVSTNVWPIYMRHTAC